MRRLEHLLGVSRAELLDLANHAGRHYSPFLKSPRPRPFAHPAGTAKLRVIDNPSTEMKRIQSLIKERLLNPLDLPGNVLGGIKGRSVLQNVAIHRNSRTLLKVDVKRYFPNITNEHVYDIWSKLLGCSPRISSMLTRLTTFQRHLPQGSPTSTILANLVLCSCDAPIRSECSRLDLQYSSWVDDLAFSGEDPRPIITTVVSTLRTKGLQISRKKLEIAGPRSKKVLTGVALGASLNVPANRLGRIRSGIHKLRTNAVSPTELPRYVQGLRGRITHLGSINAKKAEQFKKELETVLQSYPDL